MNIVARTQIKDIVGDFNISTDFYLALDQEVIRIVKKSVERAKRNSRRTVMARDI